MIPIIASVTVLTKGGSSVKLPRRVLRSMPKNASEQHKRKNTPPKIATIPVALTEADRFAELATESLYTISCNDREAERGRGRKGEFVLDVRFFFA
jgi:hypothetical protein